MIGKNYFLVFLIQLIKLLSASKGNDQFDLQRGNVEDSSSLERIQRSPKKIVCYYTNWSQYRPDEGKFTPEFIDENLCTHINFAFAKIKDSKLKSVEWNDERMYAQVIELKKQNRNLKVLLSVGGWNQDLMETNRVLRDADSRAIFVQSCVSFIKKHKFDGLDIDFESKLNTEEMQRNKKLFTILLQDLSEEFKQHKFLLTAAIAGSKISKEYEIPEISNYLSFINLMGYDFHGMWEKKTAPHSPLLSKFDDVTDDYKLTVDFAVNYLLSQGISAEKIVLGIGLFGRSFKLVDPTENSVDDLADGKPTPGKFTNEPGYLSTYEICDNLGQGWTKKWSNDQKVPYAFSNDGEWVGFEDRLSVIEKAKYAKLKELGGLMFWALDMDDFDGKFCNDGKYPLITAAKLELSRPINNNIGEEKMGLDTQSFLQEQSI